LKLIVGLGNPDAKYELTRHNAGFWVVDRLATEYGASFQSEKKFKAYFAKVQTEAGATLLAKPLTYMNLSGEAVQAISQFYKLELSDLLVIHDDVALPLGKIRVQSGGGAGGQHGVEDIIDIFGGKNGFDRIKFGVGPDPGGDRRADFVLSPIAVADQDLKEKVLKMAVDAAKMWLRQGAKPAANQFNGVDLRPKPEPPPAPPPETPQQTPPETPLPPPLPPPPAI
jgi:PTH1 family peptidyl-tRNA hydrolase